MSDWLTPNAEGSWPEFDVDIGGSGTWHVTVSSYYDYLEFRFRGNPAAGGLIDAVVGHELGVAFLMPAAADASPIALVESEELHAATEMSDSGEIDVVAIAQVVLRAHERSTDIDSPVPVSTVPLLPDGEDWDAWFPAAERQSYWPSADLSRSFLRDGGPSLRNRRGVDRVEFFFDEIWPVEEPEPRGAPWYFRAQEVSPGLARVLHSFMDGALGADDCIGYVMWRGETMLYLAEDMSLDRRWATRLAVPAELRTYTPSDPAWWLALARLLLLTYPDAYPPLDVGTTIAEG